MAKEKKFSLAKLRDLAKDYPLVSLISFLTVSLSSIFTIVTVSGSIINVFNNTINWRATEESKINKLAAGATTSYINSVLGSPVIRTSEKSNEYIENFYKQRGYWVQTIEDKDGAVQFMSVTVCDQSFKPTIHLSFNDMKLQLNHDHFTDVGNNIYQPDLFNYFLGNTAKSYFLEGSSMGNPSNYQTIYWGIDGYCSFPDSNTEIRDSAMNCAASLNCEYINKMATHVDFLNLSASNSSDLNSYEKRMKYYSDNRCEESVPCSESDQHNLLRFRSSEKINIFAITAPFADVNTIENEFGIGVEKTRARVLENLLN